MSSFEQQSATNEKGTDESLRFGFGRNWAEFIEQHFSEARVESSRVHLLKVLRLEALNGRSFLDIGCGSGLHSLAALRAGAAKVVGFDYDANSVATSLKVREMAANDDARWSAEQGSVLDPARMRALENFDIVYSWGVLHHTGAMWDALGNVAPLVAPGGLLFISIYNDQRGMSGWWRWLKRTYNRLPRPLQLPYTVAVMGPHEVLRFAATTARTRDPRAYFKHILHYAEKNKRGMSYWHDLVDWIGGYPFEVASPEAIFDFYMARNFELIALKTCGGRCGCCSGDRWRWG